MGLEVFLLSSMHSSCINQQLGSSPWASWGRWVLGRRYEEHWEEMFRRDPLLAISFQESREQL